MAASSRFRQAATGKRLKLQPTPELLCLTTHQRPGQFRPRVQHPFERTAKLDGFC